MDATDINIGDARRCPRHPHEATSSPDGLFDTPCRVCELEMDAEDAGEAAQSERDYDDGSGSDWGDR